MQDPVFSVIITTYNRAHMLPRAIRSVLGQTFRDFELLVVDNGSTDLTESVVAAIEDGRIRYIRNLSPTSSCDAPRNLGIRMARGKYISFLDDDDLWYPEKLEKVKKIFDIGQDVSCVCHYETRNVNGKIDGMCKYGPWSEDFHERLIYDGNQLSPSAVTVRTEVLRELSGFKERREYCEVADYDLWIRMAARRLKVRFIEEALGEFFNTGFNWSIKSVDFNKKVANMIRRHILDYERRSMLSISKKGMWRLFKLYAVAGKSYARAGKYGRAMDCFIKTSFFVIRRPSLAIELYKEIAIRGLSEIKAGA